MIFFRPQLPTSGPVKRDTVKVASVQVLSTVPSGIDKDESLFSLKPRVAVAADGIGISVQLFESVGVTDDASTLELGNVLISSTNDLNSTLITPPDTLVTSDEVTDSTAFTWFVDPCWESLYKHDGSGTTIKGSLDALIDAVEAGNKIRVFTKGAAFEPNLVRVRSNIVTAQGSRLLRDTVTSFEFPSQIVYFEVATTGLLQEIVIYYENFTSSTVPDKNPDIEWFAQKRSWQHGARFNLSTQAIESGSTETLDSAILAGKDARLGLDIDDYTMFFDLCRFGNDFGGNTFMVSTEPSGDTFTWSTSSFNGGASWSNLLVFQSGGTLEVRIDEISLNGTTYTQNSLSSNTTYVDVYTEI